MEATIMNRGDWDSKTLFLTKVVLKKGSIIEYENNRYEVMDIPVVIEGNPIIRLDLDIKNAMYGKKIKVIKI